MAFMAYGIWYGQISITFTAFTLFLAKFRLDFFFMFNFRNC